jgi:hypothetical protein
MVQGANQGRCQGGSLVEHNLNDLLTWGIHDEKAADMKHIARVSRHFSFLRI